MLNCSHKPPDYSEKHNLLYLNKDFCMVDSLIMLFFRMHIQVQVKTVQHFLLEKGLA